MLLRPENLDTSAKLAEFDQWLTAKLERIKDSSKFSTEIKSLCKCIHDLSDHLDNFSDHELCQIDKLCDAVISVSSSLITGDSFAQDEKDVSSFFEAFFNLLFLTTGATDNNLKNHFLIKLKDDDIKALIPKKNNSKKNITFRLVDIPASTKSDYIAKSLASCFVGASEPYNVIVKTEPFFDLSFYSKVLLKEYVALILEDLEEVMQLWAVCHSYIALCSASESGDLGKYLLNACTIFKVRGSVSATGGHITEDLLRKKLTAIGLRPNLDFNLNDVKVGSEEVVENGKRKSKTRAYDFILPYNVDNWEPKPKLFIQSQFYAGDSGSVSHKVVDQTKSSRDFTLDKYGAARFVEYLDGAGYYASLRGDLSHMLDFKNTSSFFQVKSILVRLRRELQIIEFLTPVEFEHAILVSDSSHKEDIFNLLESDGYPKEEIERIASVSTSLGYVEEDNSIFTISSERIDIARRLLILDIAANNSNEVTAVQKKSQKYLLVPGYGADKGILESSLINLVTSKCKQFTVTGLDFINDIGWLLDEGVLKRC
jgi:hypothetical protein